VEHLYTNLHFKQH